MLFDKLAKSWNEQDVQTYRSCFHDDWQFTFHSSGKVITRADDSPEEEMREFMKNMKRENPRCLYENDDILVVHDFINLSNNIILLLAFEMIEGDCSYFSFNRYP